MDLDTMVNMSVLVQSRDDIRRAEVLKADTRAMLVRVLDHNALPLDGDYTLEEWINFKRNWQLCQTY